MTASDAGDMRGQSAPHDQPVGAAMVIGGGVSGIQASLDLANAGFRVYLIEKGPSIGGKMAQLDKTFPTNDCSMCILSPKFIECSTNPNISIITEAEVESVEGEAGRFRASVIRAPRYVDPEKCTGCAICTEYCPVSVTDHYNAGIGNTKCIHLPFAQAVPLVSTIDPSACLFFLRQECQICKPICANKAIDFHQQETRLSLDVGGIILAPGYEAFDPSTQSYYRYSDYANVVTSLEYERLLSASGPFRGELVRPGDGRQPSKVAWIQCVGSRDVSAGNPYCSGVCCMYAVKQVILSKEHNPELEAVIFHNDIRAHGKGFERYAERAKALPGVRFIWSKASVLREDPETGGVVLRFRGEDGSAHEESFDMVILSVGLTSPRSTTALARRLSVETDDYGFCLSSDLAPAQTTRAGVFHCGVFHGPMDIPDSVVTAGGAASGVMELLTGSRHTLTGEKEYPAATDVSGAAPRVGVFVCDCGTNILRGVDVPSVVRYAAGLENVLHAEEDSFACSIDSVGRMIETIREKGLNRAVVAACTPRTHEPVFQNALREAGLNPGLLEMANIREHCSLVHMLSRREATEKAKDLVRMAVAKALTLGPLGYGSYPVKRAALVIGGGLAGITSALALADQGIRVHLVERSPELGGNSLRISKTPGGAGVGRRLTDLVDRVNRHLNVQVHTGAELIAHQGYVGNFSARILRSNRSEKEITHGITIVATGAGQWAPDTFLHGEDPAVLTLLELEEALSDKDPALDECQRVVFIQCIGPRNAERPYCSRVCCTHSVRSALDLKERNGEAEITVLYRDMRTFGLKELLYKEACERGVQFVRFDSQDPPEVKRVEEAGSSFLRVTVAEPILGYPLALDADMLVLAAAIVPAESNKALSTLLKVPLDQDGFFMEAHMKLRPVDFATEGIFVCGMSHGPKFTDESIVQAKAAAARAMTVLSRDIWTAGGIVGSLDPSLCTGCGVCVSVCPFGALDLDKERSVAVLNEAVCKGCGVCSSSCRSGALDIQGFSDAQTFAQIFAA